MGDLAIYAKGPARPTGGAGAIALLIGTNAPLVFERGLRATHITHAYDFYKPVMESEYPIVDGHLSVVCYLSALERCYSLLKTKFRRLKEEKKINPANNNTKSLTVNEKIYHDVDNDTSFTIESADAFLFHSPYCKLVQKSFARLYWIDCLETSYDDKKKQIHPNFDEVIEKSLKNLSRFRYFPFLHTQFL